MNILSIDGGGIRGLVPALIIAELERLTRRPASQTFGLIAGTSTGGILALGLAKPGPSGTPAYSAAQLARLYREDGERIFPRRRLFDRLATWRKTKYPAAGLEAVLAEKFGETRLSEAITPVLVPAVEIERARAWMFKSRTAADDGDWTMAAIARATSAAPTYFAPAQFPGSGHPPHAFIDGGLGANNPAMCAIAEALDLGAKFDEIRLVSIGTGAVRNSLRYEDASSFGLVQWARPILSLLMAAPADAVDYQCRRTLGRRYTRMQLELPRELGSLDDASPRNLDGLALATDDWLSRNERFVQDVAASLT